MGSDGDLARRGLYSHNKLWPPKDSGNGGENLFSPIPGLLTAHGPGLRTHKRVAVDIDASQVGYASWWRTRERCAVIYLDRIRASAIVRFRSAMQAIALWIIHSEVHLHILRILVVENRVHHAGPCRKVANSRSIRSIADTKVATLFPRLRSEKAAPAGQLTRAGVPVMLALYKADEGSAEHARRV